MVSEINSENLKIVSYAESVFERGFFYFSGRLLAAVSSQESQS